MDSPGSIAMFFDDKTRGAVVVGGTLISLILIWSHMRGGNAVSRKKYRLPPSPPSTSIMGHRLPPEDPYTMVKSWVEQYGPVISLRAGVSRVVIIGRHQAAMDIMEKQGAVLVDRPRLVASGEMLGGGLRTVLTRAGERFKRMRRALHTHFQPKAARTYEPLQTSYAKKTILGLLESPEQFRDHARAYASSVVLKLTYGRNTPVHASDPIIVQIQKSLQRFAKAVLPGAFLVDVLPWLKYLPWYGLELRRGFIEDRELFHGQLDAVKSQMRDPESGPSFAKFLLAREIDFGLDETEMAFLAGGLFAAGVDTTSLAICVAMIAAARFPDAQAAVRAELDAVVGNGRLPTFEDEESLPVFRAFILESMRWRPQIPVGLPHRAMEDIIWGDYCIPAGTTVLGNNWAISRDPEVFPNPDKFDLTRWLTLDGSLREDLKFLYFGFGRRVCPGQHVATRSIFINTVFVLWSFYLSVDESKPADDMAFMNIMCNDQPISLLLEPRLPRETLKTMMEEHVVG